MEENTKYPLGDWRYDVSNDATRLGYADWVAHNLESHQPAITNEDWVEIYYALIDKQSNLDNGEAHIDGIDEFSDHLGRIIDKIGSDGENMYT
jgi:hypothetical protein